MWQPNCTYMCTYITIHFGARNGYENWVVVGIGCFFTSMLSHIDKYVYMRGTSVGRVAWMRCQILVYPWLGLNKIYYVSGLMPHKAIIRSKCSVRLFGGHRGPPCDGREGVMRPSLGEWMAAPALLIDSPPSPTTIGGDNFFTRWLLLL